MTLAAVAEADPDSDTIACSPLVVERWERRPEFERNGLEAGEALGWR